MSEKSDARHPEVQPVAELARRRPRGLDGTFSGTCIVCLRATDTGLGFRGDVTWQAASLIVLGLPRDEAVATVNEHEHELGPDGRYEVIHRLCTDCASRVPQLEGPRRPGHRRCQYAHAWPEVGSRAPEAGMTSHATAAYFTLVEGSPQAAENPPHDATVAPRHRVDHARVQAGRDGGRARLRARARTGAHRPRQHGAPRARRPPGRRRRRPRPGRRREDRGDEAPEPCPASGSHSPGTRCRSTMTRSTVARTSWRRAHGAPRGVTVREVGLA